MSRFEGRFMRLVLFFDLPVETNQEKREYRNFIKFLTEEGYIRLQYSVYCRLCINNDAAQTALKKAKKHTPLNGDVRILSLTEGQFQKIINVNDTHSLQEEITTINRTLMIGGMNDED